MTDASNTPQSASKIFATTFDHPCLTTPSASSIRILHSSYDQYVAEVQEHARQLVAQDVITTEIFNPVHLNKVLCRLRVA